MSRDSTYSLWPMGNNTNNSSSAAPAYNRSRPQVISHPARQFPSDPTDFLSSPKTLTDEAASPSSSMGGSTLQGTIKGDDKMGWRRRQRRGSERSIVDDEERKERFRQGMMRIFHGLSHAGLCAVTMYIMILFLSTPIARARNAAPNNNNNNSQNNLNDQNRNQAFALVTVLVLDVLLDLHALWRFRHPWPARALAARLALGVAYMAVFAAYYALGNRVFPARFAYWGMPRGFSSPFVYLFMWTLGVWDLMHVTMHRGRLGELFGGRKRASVDEEEYGMGGGGGGHARKGSVESQSSSWKPWKRAGSGEDDVDVEAARGRAPVRPSSPPPRYLDSVALNKWRASGALTGRKSLEIYAPRGGYSVYSTRQ